MTGSALVTAVRQELSAAGDPDRAREQQRYMKSTLPFRGLTAPELRTLLRPVLDEHRIHDRGEWEHAARELWDGATYREEWYATLALLRHRFYRPWRDPESLDLALHLVRTGAWWDVVDEAAAHLVGGVLAGYRDRVTPWVDAWAEDEQLWVRRTAVLAQLRHGDRTDTALLARVLDANLEGSRHGSEFFIRKAVGWALRQYARTDEVWVRAYVAERRDRLSGLSRREALKHLGGDTGQTGTRSSAPTR
jgi:3-methyladenine DNA glycosylase AlkD